MVTRGIIKHIEKIAESGQGMLCPFTPKSILCEEPTCNGCAIKADWDREEGKQGIENMESYLQRLDRSQQETAK